MKRFLLFGAAMVAVTTAEAAGAQSAEVAAFLRRADSGEEPAILGAAGDIYLEGVGVDRDWAKARDYYRKAIASGVGEVSNKLAFLDFALADAEFFRTNRTEALKAIIQRDPVAAGKYAKRKFGVAVVDEVSQELALLMMPHDGFWHGIESAEEWSANIRTNSNLRTCLDFCEKDLIPFVLRTWFGEKDRKTAWYPEAQALIAGVVKHWWRSGDLRVRNDAYADANKLVEKGCDNVAVRWLAGLSRGKEESLRWFEQMELDADRHHSPELARWLAAMARRHWLRTESERRRSVDCAIAWVRAGAFSKADSHSVYRLLAIVNHPVKKEMAAALSGFDGVDPDIATALAECDEGMPVFPELGGKLIADSCSNADDVFSVASREAFDDCMLNFKYLFYECLPRVSGSIEKTERFGNACFDAGRFDTMLPLIYLDAQFLLAVEQDMSLERYFADKERFAKCMKAADALVGNKNVYTRACRAATYYKAMLTYCGGDLSTLRKFFTDDYVKNMPPTYMIDLAESYGAMVGALAALSGVDAEKTVPLHRKFRDGRFSEFASEAKALLSQSGLSREAQDYLRMYGKIAALRSPDYNGGWIEADLVQSDAEMFTRFPHWRRDRKGQGWFVSPHDGNQIPIKWNMPLGDEYEVEIGLNPLRGCRVANATIQYWVPHYERQPLPEVCCEFANRKVRVVLKESGNKEEESWYSDPVVIPYTGGIVPIRVLYRDGRVSVWLGNQLSANLTTDRFASSFSSLKGKGGNSVVCARGLCLRSWKARSMR